MFRDDPFAVVGGELAKSLESAGATVRCRHDDYYVEYQGRSAKVEFRPPDEPSGERGAIHTVVTVRGALPEPRDGRPPDDETLCTLNRSAALAGAMSEHERLFAGARLTVYRGEYAWHDLQLPLLTAAVIDGIRAFGLHPEQPAPVRSSADSTWAPADLCAAAAVLSRLSFCTHDEGGLTAEFPLAEGELSALAGDSRTAMLQMVTDRPHPVLGGGLECLLQMPHQVEDRARLARLCNQLNRMEMARLDLPPHFGAWRPGEFMNNPTYVTFLPDSLHAISGIAVNVGVWAAHRARWASVALAALGVKTPAVTPLPYAAIVPDADADMDWRPDDYWDEDGYGEYTPLNEFERRMELAEASGDWSDCELPVVPFAMRGGDFLPRLRGNEVEIARLSLDSTTWDVISIRARRVGRRIAYRVVDEYETNYVIRPKTSKRPLTLGQLIALIDGLSDGEQSRSPTALRDDQLIYGDPDQIEETADFVTVSSPYYADLEDWYTRQAMEWAETRLAEREARNAAEEE